VSPIIATILLVAITVVLAAVLYVLISGLTHGAGAAPLGTNFGYGTAINDTGVKTLGCGTTGYCYGVEINVGGGLTISNFILSLKNPTGSTVAWPAAVAATTAACAAAAPTAACIQLVSPTSSTPVAVYSTASSGWSAVGTFTGTITSGSSIVIYFNTAAGAGLLGDQLVAVGSSGYSGTVASGTFS
jgi:flagellin-like protein